MFRWIERLFEPEAPRCECCGRKFAWDGKQSWIARHDYRNCDKWQIEHGKPLRGP